jgi:hypothetical protein
MEEIGDTMFKKAIRRQSKLRLAITGPSGAGKTYSALRLAKGLGGKLAFIDTENGSASLYSAQFEFDVIELQVPLANEKYIDAIKMAERAGYETLIIDSMSHGWLELLEKKTATDFATKQNNFTTWATFTPKQNAFIAAILQSPLNIICTMRVKTDYVLQANEKGKIVPQKIGLAPIQRDGVEYEFTTIFDIDIHHQVNVSKDRTGLFIRRTFQIEEQTGELFNKWLQEGTPFDPVEFERQIKSCANFQQLKSVLELHWPDIKNRMDKDSLLAHYEIAKKTLGEGKVRDE